MISPPTFLLLASLSVIIPIEVDTIAKPNPFFILGMLVALT